MRQPDNIVDKFLQKISAPFIFGMLLGAFLSSLFLGEKEHAYIDMSRVITSVTTKLQQEENLEEAIEQHKEYFQKLLQEYSREHRKIIFSSPKPIAGAIDVTDYFIKALTDFVPGALP